MSEELDAHGFYQIESRIDAVLTGLGFEREDEGKNSSELAGGMKTKLILGKILLSEFDLLILDEPTNFLDIKYIAWLGEYLNAYKGAYIVISHDAAFLNKIAKVTIEIANRILKVYNGNYDYYLKEKARRENIQAEQHIAQEKYIARSQSYIDSLAGSGILGSKATWLKKMLETLERIEKPDEIIKPKFEFRYLKGSSRRIVEASGLVIGYDRALTAPLNFSLERGRKILFRGYNGAGKTTLLKTLNGDLTPLSSEILFGENIESVFLRQEEDYDNCFSRFNNRERARLGIKRGHSRELTVIELAIEHFPEMTQKELQRAMFSCGLTEKHFWNPVRSLSGGEMVRFRLCMATLRAVNLIVLDEPTNHLDVFSKEVLMRSLADFEGSVIMTSHDVNADTEFFDEVLTLGI